MEQLEEDCEAVLLFVLYPPRGALLFFLWQYIFLYTEICFFCSRGYGNDWGIIFVFHAGAGNNHDNPGIIT